MQVLLTIFILFVVCCNLIYAADENSDASANAQQIAMNQEIIESLWNILSPQCKTEMENALGSQGDISDHCKAEVQSGLISLRVIPDPNGEGGKSNFNEQSSSKSQDFVSDTNPNPSSRFNVVLAILGFTFSLFGIAFGYIVYYNSSTTNLDSNKKVKKLSKKKEEKLRQKGGR